MKKEMSEAETRSRIKDLAQSAKRTMDKECAAKYQDEAESIVMAADFARRIKERLDAEEKMRQEAKQEGRQEAIQEIKVLIDAILVKNLEHGVNSPMQKGWNIGLKSLLEMLDKFK